MSTRALYIPHGGGPLPLLDDPGHTEMVEYLNSAATSIGRPSAIVVVSAHWESERPAITAGPSPDLYFDYYGFPPATYEYEYPAPGSTELAASLGSALATAGFDPLLDTERGLDHGVFVPLMLMYPDAGIPTVQVSLLDGLDPEDHIRLGQALSPAVDDGVLVLGSGMSFHNMRAFGPGDDSENLAFDRWLEATCTGGLSEDDRRRELAAWADAPGARHSHPREEHLIPLHVCYGLSGSAASRTFDGHVLGKRVGAYAWS